MSNELKMLVFTVKLEVTKDLQKYEIKELSRSLLDALDFAVDEWSADKDEVKFYQIPTVITVEQQPEVIVL